VKLVVDLMGGDHAPQAVLDGVRSFMAAAGGVSFDLVGLPEVVAGLRGAFDPERVGFIEAGDIIAADEQPALAVRRKRDSSVVVGMERVRDGLADAFVSCGSTGALMAAGLFAFGRLPGVRRPALGSPFPNLVHPGPPWFMLDIGANVDATAGDLRTYALIGSLYSRLVLGVDSPRVGLLNIGVEDQKGNAVVREAHALLSAMREIRFSGNIEARDIFAGPADVIVCDGFAGNLVLKSVEGLAAALVGAIREELASDSRARVAGLLARPYLRRAVKRMDYTVYGGAPLFGLAGACIKCHGSSNAVAVASGLGVAREFVSRGVLQAMRAALASMAPEPRRGPGRKRDAGPAGTGGPGPSGRNAAGGEIEIEDPGCEKRGGS
jgi:glycerol-3-phosphate acyltransferase PlsX